MVMVWNDFPHYVPNVMDITDQLRAFVATAQTGSFTAAAERLGISNRLTSKYVAELEERLGTRLLQRTTRRVGLTPAGERMLAEAPALLDGLDDLLSDVSEQSRGFSGSLRISAPVTFGEVYVAEMLARFAAPHLDLTIDLQLSDAQTDLAAEGIDLAFRIGTLSDHSLRARKLCDIGMRVVASPDYLAHRERPERPEDLARHRCIHDTNHGPTRRWRFRNGGSVLDVPVPAQIMVNSARATCELALAGHGIAYGPDFVMAPEIAAGRLVSIFPPEILHDTALHAVYLDGPKLPRKLRALIEFAREDARKAFDPL